LTQSQSQTYTRTTHFMPTPEVHVYPIRGIWFAIFGALFLLVATATVVEFGGVLYSIETDGGCSGIQISSFVMFASCGMYVVAAIMLWLADRKILKIYQTETEIQTSSKYQLASIALLVAALLAAIAIVTYTVNLPDIMSVPTSLGRACANSQFYLPLAMGIVALGMTGAAVVLIRPRAYFLFKQSEEMRRKIEMLSMMSGKTSAATATATAAAAAMTAAFSDRAKSLIGGGMDQYPLVDIKVQPHQQGIQFTNLASAFEQSSRDNQKRVINSVPHVKM